MMMDFQVTTALKKLAKLKKRKRVVQGGTSASKTWSILPLLIDKAQSVPNREISVVSESIPHLRRGALKDFLKILVATGRFDANKFNKSTLKYTFSNGSYIEFFSADQDDKLRGARRTDLYVNEANNVSFEAYNQLAIRTSGTIWIDFNPTSTFWAHTEIATQEDADFIKLTYKDNEGLPLPIVKELESNRVKALTSTYWANWCSVYLDGEIGNLEGACIPDWSRIDKLPEEARLLCYGMDFGYTNDETTLIGLYKWNDGYIFDEVIYQKGLLNSDISRLLKEGDIKDIVWADSAEPKSIAELKSYGHLVEPVKKGKDSIIYGLNLINQNKIYVTSNSVNLINELQNYVWLKDREGNTLNKPISRYDHCIDSCRYALMMQLDNPNMGSYNLW